LFPTTTKPVEENSSLVRELGMKWLFPVTVIYVAINIFPGSADGQAPPTPQAPASQLPGPVFAPLTPWTFPNREAVNAGTVTIVTAPAGGASVMFGSDMARVLDEKDVLRVLPVISKGPVQNVVDMLYLKSVDMGLVTADVPEFFKLQYNSNIHDRLRYIMKLYNNEIHIIAPTSIKTVFDLDGKRIEAPKDVGLYSARAIFSRLNLNVTYDYLTDDTGALQRVVDGQADAWIVSTGKTMPIARNLKNEDRRLHLVSIPYDPRLQDLYLPSAFTSEEYPNLIAPGETVETLAASVLLAVFNWNPGTERYTKVARFVDALFSKVDEFYKPPRHPKWKEASITAVVPGWQRFKAAQDWLDRNQVLAEAAKQASLSKFRQFLAERGVAGRNDLSQDEVLRLYNQFIEWSRRTKN
jgi:TRAP-type uncharacterized transport system substrate-binding protein